MCFGVVWIDKLPKLSFLNMGSILAFLQNCLWLVALLVEHVMDNGLLTDKQWAYRKNHSTQLLLVHLTECWRQALDRNLVVATAFVDFRKAFDCVSHKILLSKLKHRFGIEGHLLSWLTDYLNQRSQITVGKIYQMAI